MVQHVLVFDALRAQVAQAEEQGISHSSLASQLADILKGADAPRDALVLRLAWVVVVHAPAYDPVLVVTLPFCLESIAEGYGAMDDLFDHVQSAEPVPGAPTLPEDLPRRPVERLLREVSEAVESRRTDPAALDRIIDRIACEPSDVGGSAAPFDPDRGSLRVVDRMPLAVRNAMLSVLEIEPAPGAVSLMHQIADRLDARGVRRLAEELVHGSHDASALRIRVRAAAALLAMERGGLFDPL